MRITDGAGHEQVDLDEVDLSDANLYVTGDPHRIWRAMLDRDPIRWQEAAGGGFWSVTRYADVDRVLRDHTEFTSERGNLLDVLGKGDSSAGQQMAATDPPRHTTLRAPIQRALAAKGVGRLTEPMRNEARRLFDQVRTSEPFDFAMLTAQYSMAITALVMGFDRNSLLELLRSANRAMAPDDPEYRVAGGRDETMRIAHWELFSYFEHAVRTRRRRPREEVGGLVDQLLTMRLDDGRRMDDYEVIGNCYGLLLGTNVATPHVPNSTLLKLIEDELYPTWAATADDLKGKVEEALRWSSPANHFMRYAVVETKVGGKRIRPGEAVVAWLGAANRDPEIFPDPYRLDFGRRPNRHVAFGVGPHYCVGHTVARAALGAFFTELFEAFADFQLAGDVEHLHSNVAAGVKHMPVTARRR